MTAEREEYLGVDWCALKNVGTCECFHDCSNYDDTLPDGCKYCRYLILGGEHSPKKHRDKFYKRGLTSSKQ